MAKVTLAVHPRFGEEVAVSPHGRHSVWAETPDGRHSLLPLRWTTLHPRAEPLSKDGRAVRLAPESLRELSAWVVARTFAARSCDGKKLASESGKREKVGDGEDSAGGIGSTTTVVGQARSSGVDRRVERRKRGVR
jgi:hypothetical protein